MPREEKPAPQRLRCASASFVSPALSSTRLGMLVTSPGMGKPYQPKDHFFRQAKDKGLRARSAFKIEEILKRFALLRKGSAVLDLGAAPGGFLQILAEAVGT